MSNAERRGPAVDDCEALHRLIATPDWWHDDRPSSAAFKAAKFSVNVASLATLEATTRQLCEDLGCPEGGIVSFKCGDSRELGYDPRLELDELNPENHAHAHVYFDGPTSQRMKSAKRLALRCDVLLRPTFPTSNGS